VVRDTGRDSPEQVKHHPPNPLQSG
jgi:hypothetical protein